MQITVERVTHEEPFEDTQDLLLARFTIHDADPDAYEAQRAITAEIKAMPNLNQTLLDLEPARAAPSGDPDIVRVVIPMPHFLVEDRGFNLATALAPEIAEAYVYTLANRARTRP